jgi:hypothetical protein
MKQRLAVKLGSNTSVFEQFRPHCARRDTDGSATCQGQLPYNPGFEAVRLRLNLKILRGWFNFRPRFIGLTPKTHE